MEKFDCDARCTNAKGLVCVCWCGGVNHGRDAYPATERGVEAHADDGENLVDPLGPRIARGEVA